mmetsp:Transcript_78002/g.223535  ORF Transcript_78002/g.223535 Transcript_78002/m.223535 type:complete len:80 (+) Transcript_78002:329-568(+)
MLSVLVLQLPMKQQALMQTPPGQGPYGSDGGNLPPLERSSLAGKVMVQQCRELGNQRMRGKPNSWSSFGRRRKGFTKMS